MPVTHVKVFLVLFVWDTTSTCGFSKNLFFFFSPSIFYPACHHILSGSLNESVLFTHNCSSVPEGCGTAGFQTSRDEPLSCRSNITQLQQPQKSQLAEKLTHLGWNLDWDTSLYLLLLENLRLTSTVWGNASVSLSHETSALSRKRAGEAITS